MKTADKMFTFRVTGSSRADVEKKVADHELRGAILIGEIKEEYYENKTFNNTGFHRLHSFNDNFESVKFYAVMGKKHIENKTRQNRWNYY